jgi:predicted Zn-dependent peptidase
MYDYLTRHYRASNIVVSAAGFIEADPALQKIASALGEFQPAPRESYLPFQNGQHAARWHIRHKSTEQAHVVVSTWAYPRMHPDRYVVSTLSTILGEGMSSRLWQAIREERGLAYSVSAFGGSLEDCGYLGSYAAVEPKNAAPTLDAMLHEWARLRDDPVPEDELNKAKELMKGHLLLSMEDTHSIAGWYGRQEALGHEILTVDDVTAGIDAVTAAGVQRVARDLFRNEWLNLAVVGPFKSESRFVRALAL